MRFIKQFFYLGWWWLRAFLGRRKPMQSVIFISDRCNLSCKHCSVYNHKNPVSKTYEQIRGELAECYAKGARFVDFEGGEPFIWRDGDKTVNDLCTLARSMGFFSCTITTNAQLPFDGSVADSIWVSMDGIGEYHERIRGAGSFARLEQNIATCGCRALSANMVVNALNYENVEAAVRYVKDSPYFKSISINFHTPFPGTEYLALDQERREKVVDLVLALKKEGCPVMNSCSGLRKMRNNRFRRRCWMTNFVFADGSKADQCIGKEVGVCDQCGFCMAGEESAVMELRPDTLLAGLRLRV